MWAQKSLGKKAHIKGTDFYGEIVIIRQSGGEKLVGIKTKKGNVIPAKKEELE